MGELVSVIVPIYNVEKYLKNCVNSIITQTYKNIEIILVDDGSPDNCGEICDQYANQDERIVVIHKPNGGLSDARNCGLEKAHGAYVTFIDSDDFISSVYVEILMKAISENDAEIAICDEKRFFENEYDDIASSKELNTRIINLKILSSVDTLKSMLYQGFPETSACAKLFKIGLFNDVKFPLGKAYEDLGTVYKVVMKSKNIVCVSNKLYYYFQRTGSILHTYGNSKRYWDGISLVEQKANDVVRFSSELELPAKCRMLSMYFHAFIEGQFTSDNKLKEYSWNEIRKLRWDVLTDDNARKKARVAAALSYFGKEVFLFLANKK